ncbi:Soluble lytic murein transglycosylase-like regulatory protein [Rickettsia slovaca 13-B]|uniref:Soluble lytic murein transglycosylase-like regulatory protein n=1 Tax=Rickettsia slovaca (strain 13-B) TaxID=941638 RepID=A0ABM5MSB8_RICS1|nr:Soluble lytic murein transglycosylase-like regulatory protein [Rickettsia slovaca 13-B]
MKNWRHCERLQGVRQSREIKTRLPRSLLVARNDLSLFILQCLVFT